MRYPWLSRLGRFLPDAGRVGYTGGNPGWGMDSGIDGLDLNWKVVSNTPQKFNMEPENDGFQKESPFPGTSFQVPC